MAKVPFTAGRIASFKCPVDKAQAFLWDSTAPGLGLRATPAGKPSFIFQRPHQGRDVRITIGSPTAWSIGSAQAKARELQRLIDEGHDPRGLKRDAVAAAAERQSAEVAKQEANKVAALTVADVWDVYLKERRPHWGDLHYRDHVDKAKLGGQPSGRRGAGQQLTKPGPLASLMPMRLRELDQGAVEAWAAREGKIRPSSARLAWRLLTVFLTWCGEQPEYASVLPSANPAKTKRAREALGRAGTKSDVLQREQLADWFTAVLGLSNPVIAACLQVMLLTGARPGEVLALRWKDINTQWRGISIRDKVEGAREIPATPYVLHLVLALPRRNEWVFSSPTSESGCLTEPNNPHTRACAAAGLDGLTLHGLRRSFASLTEWLETPAGVVAQIQGHKPSATAEKHYKVRPLELLRVHHQRIEAWMLEQANVVFVPEAGASALRAIGE